MLDNFDSLVQILDYSLDSKRKRHIAGGILLSISLLFGGLAFTTISMRDEYGDEDEKNEQKQNKKQERKNEYEW